ncbi:MAG: SRPBCC family protein [Gaiellaceae bacterium]
MTSPAVKPQAATTQVYSIFIRATPEQVWEAITTPEFTRRYFHGSEIDSTFEPGSPYKSWSPTHEQLWVEGEVVESNPPERLVHTWLSLYDEEAAGEQPSRVAWEIELKDGGITKLTVVHDRLERSPKTAAGVSGGWMYVLSGLKTVLETGASLESA